MLLNPFKPERSSSPRLHACDAGSKKTSHSPWTASKPRKKNRQFDDGSAYEDEESISIGTHNDENVAPSSCANVAGAGLDVNMLASGFEKLRVFRKASGVKGARQMANQIASSVGGISSKHDSNGFQPCFEHEHLSQGGNEAGRSGSTQLNPFLLGVQPLRTASEPVCRPAELYFAPSTMNGSASALGILSVVTEPSQSVGQDKQDTACFTPQATEESRSHHSCFQQPFGVPAVFGASCDLPREGLSRPLDITALSADHILMGPPPPRPPGNDSRSGSTVTTLTASTTISQLPSFNSQASQPPHGMDQDNMVDAHQGSGKGMCPQGEVKGESHALDEQEEDGRPFLLPPLCLEGEDEGDVWDEDFRIVTRPLGWAAGCPPSEVRGGQNGWEPGPRGGGGALYTPTTASCTPRVLLHGFTVTPVSAARAGAIAGHANCLAGAGGRGGMSGAPGSSGRPMVRCYGRVGYCSTATSTGGNTATPAPKARRRAPTPAGHLLGHNFLDEEDEDEEGMGVQGAGEADGRGAGRMNAERPTGAAGAVGAGAIGGVGKGAALLKAVAKALGRLGPKDAAQGSQPRTSPFSIFSPGSRPRPTLSHISHPASRGPSASGGPDIPTPGGDGAGGADAGETHGRNAPLSKKHMPGAGGLWRRFGRRDTHDDSEAVGTDGGMVGGPGPVGEDAHVGVGGAALDPELRRQQEEAALANLMCDEADFYTPPHSPRAHGLPAWYLNSEARTEIRRTHSADEAMMSRDHHPGSHAGHHMARAAAAFGYHAHGGMACQMPAGYMLHSAASLEAGMELGMGMLHGKHGACCMDGSCGQPVCDHIRMAHMHDGHMHGAWGGSSWPLQGGMESGMDGLHMHSRMEEDSYAATRMMAPESLDTLEGFNGQLSLAAERGDRGRAERLWGELRGRCILPDMRTLNMLMRCLCKSVIHPDEAEELMCEVCTLGGLQPNATTLTLLAEMRLRYEQLQGCH